MHPEFNYEYNYHDIALIQTIETIVENENVAFIPLGKGYVTGGSAVVSGWGDVTPEERPESLHFAEVTVIETNLCMAKMSEATAGQVHDHTLCTTADEGVGACIRKNIKLHYSHLLIFGLI